jgi:shikimate kinase
MMSFSTSLIKKFRSDIDGDYACLTPKTIVLVGLMGSGKSALGKRLSVALSLPFIDSDALVEEEAGITIAEIFELAGETRFREMERRVIKSVLEGGACILSTGGGAFCNKETRTAITANAVSIWIDSSPETLLSRIGNPASRPLLTTGDPLEILTNLRETRAPDYAEADLYLRTGKQSHRTAMKKLLGLLVDTGHIRRLLPASAR